MESETYVRRRHWTLAEKRSVVEEAATSGNVAATAKRYGLQTQQIYRWRERLDRAAAPASFLPVTVSPDRAAAVLDQDHRKQDPAVVPDRAPRIEIVLGGDRRIIAEGAINVEVILRLARGLEAPR
ncbi:MAG: transposase [Proteobacteria bacterium]|nr:transposase [Pseudomonadota bacterium]